MKSVSYLKSRCLGIFGDICYPAPLGNKQWVDSGCRNSAGLLSGNRNLATLSPHGILPKGSGHGETWKKEGVLKVIFEYFCHKVRDLH